MRLGRYFLELLLCCVMVTGRESVCAAQPESLDARQGAMSTEAKRGTLDFSKLPLYVEFRLKSSNKDSYNIFMANGAKSSLWHWEIFSLPGTGYLNAYIPGFTPDHLRSEVNVVDGEWHQIGLRLELEKLELSMDGKVVAEVKPAKLPEKLVAQTVGSLHIGALADGALKCDALLDDVKISSDGEVCAEWDFNEFTEECYQDISGNQYTLRKQAPFQKVRVPRADQEVDQGLHVFLGTSHVRKEIYKMDRGGRIFWSYPVQAPQDVWLLENGNILTTSLHSVQLISPDKKVLWRYDVEAPNEIPNCQPLPNGNMMVGVVGLCRLLEFNPKGELVHQVQLSTPVQVAHAQFRMCRKTEAGTYLVPFTTEGAVREYDRGGKVIREFPPVSSPICAVRLPNGNTLITCDGTVKEFAPDNSVVWSVNPAVDIPFINMGVPAGVQRLPNGNTVVCNWHSVANETQDAVHIFEITPDKKLVWVMGSPYNEDLLSIAVTLVSDGNWEVAQCQLLTDDGKARKELTLR